MWWWLIVMLVAYVTGIFVMKYLVVLLSHAFDRFDGIDRERVVFDYVVWPILALAVGITIAVELLRPVSTCVSRVAISHAGVIRSWLKRDEK